MLRFFVGLWVACPSSHVYRGSKGAKAVVEICDSCSSLDFPEGNNHLPLGNPYHLLVQMRGMEISLRGGLLKGKQLGSVAFNSTECKACKHVRLDKTSRFWSHYARGLLLFSFLCLFVLLKPDCLPFSTTEMEAGTSLIGVNSGSLQYPRILNPDALSDLIEETYPIVKSETKDVRDEVSSNDLLYTSGKADQGHDTNSLNLSNSIKIFVYDLPSSFNEDWLKDDRCSNHLFAAEVAIHQRLRHSPVRTLQAEDADFYFVPVYVSCKFSSSTGFPSLGHAPSLLQSAVDLISHEMPYWNHSGGRDHIFVATHDYGPCFRTMEDLAVAAGIPSFLRKSVILQTFARVDKHACQAKDHIQIPPYVPQTFIQQGWHPEMQHRDIWAFFRGKMEIHPKNVSGRVYSRGVRTIIWKKFRRNRKFFIKRTRSPNYLSEIQRSVYCLCPLGWAPWSPRLVESVLFGCVPVIIADKISLPFSHVIDWKKISVAVPEKDVSKLDKILERISHTNLSSIQENLWKEEYRQALLYLEPITKGDATWQILDLLSRRLVLKLKPNQVPLQAATV